MRMAPRHPMSMSWKQTLPGALPDQGTSYPRRTYGPGGSVGGNGDLSGDAGAAVGRGPDREGASEGLHAVGESPQAGAALRVGTAHPVVDDLDDDRVAVLGDAYRCLSGP